MIVKREGRPNIVKMIVKRYIRFAPSVLFLLLAISLLSLWQNAGPIYNSSIEKLLRPCGKFYWANLFFTANFYSHDNVVSDIWEICVYCKFIYSKPLFVLVFELLLVYWGGISAHNGGNSRYDLCLQSPSACIRNLPGIDPGRNNCLGLYRLRKEAQNVGPLFRLCHPRVSLFHNF